MYTGFIFVGKPGERDHLEDPGVDGRIISRSEIGEGMDWIDLTQDMDRWLVFANVVMNLRVPYNVGNFLTS